MQRRKFLQSLALAFGAFTLNRQNIFKAFSDDPWKITMLTNDIGIFTERGGTIAFHSSTEGLTVVDAQFPDTATHLIEELKKRKEQPFRLLINTHHHGDHTAGNISFKDFTSRVLAHENSLKNQQNVAATQKTEDKQYYPNQTFGTVWEERAGKEKIVLHYYGAGHTNGDALIHFQHADVVHIGDLVFNRRHPFVDRSAGANMQSWMLVLEAAMKKFSAKTKYVFGHSGSGYEVTGSRSDLQAFHDYLGNVLKYTGDEIKAGKSKEEILKATAIPGSPQWTGDGIERPLGAAYDELTAS